MKRFWLFVLLVGSLLLASCWGNSEEQKYQSVKFDSVVLNIPEDFVLVNIKDSQINKFKILYEYKKQSFSGFADSLIIGQYVGDYPADEKKFFSIVMDKFVRKVPWTKLLGNWKKTIGKWIELYWFKYAVSNNVFDDKKADYYGLQAYLFEKNKSEVYVINYLTANKDNLDKILDLIKSVES